MSTSAIAGTLPRPSGRELAAQAGGGLLIAAVAAGLTAVVISGATVNGLAILIVVAGSLWFATTRRPAVALALLMVYLGVLDGYLKLATGSSYVTFVRDALLYALVAGLLVRSVVQGKRLVVPPLSGFVFAFVVLVLVQLANPLNGSPTHSLAGVRQHLEFVPLFFLAFVYVRTTKALRIFVLLLALVAAANGIAGLVQFNETPAQLAAWGPGYAQRVLGEGSFSTAGRTFLAKSGQGRTRPFGLGSDSGAGGVFGAFALAGIIALVSLHRRRGYLLVAAMLALGATAAVITSQARGVIVSSVVIVLAYGLLTSTSRGRAQNLLALALTVIVAVFAIQAIVGSLGSTSLRYQGLGPTSLFSTANKARGKSLAAIPRNLEHYPLGAGLGVAGPASQAASGGSQLTGNVDAETEFSFLDLETGIPGMLVLTGFVITVVAVGFRRCRHESDQEARILLAAVIAPAVGILALFFSSALSPSVPAGPYLWAVAGIVSYWLIARPAERRRDAAASPGAGALVSPPAAPPRPRSRRTAVRTPAR
jgi:hypothetical protein